MNILLLTACIGLIAGGFCLFRISPMEFTDGLFGFLIKKKGSIRSEIKETTKRNKISILRREITEIQEILTLTGRSSQFSMVCGASLLCFAAGAGIAILMGNVFLVPVLAAGMMFLPFWYIRLTSNHYKKNTAAELETALSIITTAYLRSEENRLNTGGEAEMIQLLIVGILFGTGLYFLLADLLHLPTRKASKALIEAGKEGKSAARTLETWLMAGAVRLSRYLRIDPYKRKRIENILRATGYNMTPELYTAYAMTKSAAILSGVIPSLLLFPLLAPFVILLAVLPYFKETQRAEEQLKEKRDQIEGELPRFVATVEQTLKSSGRDILAMLDAYKKNASPVLVKELDILTADMRSSSYEAALTRFEARFNSSMLSDVVRGLIGVLRGDDGAVYFQMLSHDFKALELQRLKSKAQKIPPKIRVFSFVMLLCFLFTYLIIIALEIVNSLGTMF